MPQFPELEPPKLFWRHPNLQYRIRIRISQSLQGLLGEALVVKISDIFIYLKNSIFFDWKVFLYN